MQCTRPRALFVEWLNAIIYEMAVRHVLFVHRKGATRAFGPRHGSLPEALRLVGQPVLIGSSTGTGSRLRPPICIKGRGWAARARRIRARCFQSLDSIEFGIGRSNRVRTAAAATIALLPNVNVGPPITQNIPAAVLATNVANPTASS